MISAKLETRETYFQIVPILTPSPILNKLIESKVFLMN
jgi:hypothetical protein